MCTWNLYTRINEGHPNTFHENSVKSLVLGTVGFLLQCLSNYNYKAE